ncbi:hypothetical protein ACFVZZ_27420, partial [Streptomyces chartreusis]|uniref:hypothetical protein n=1 Tax=Streptomyces chartreusis TaxID=1969 RepID=UPI0036D8D247
MVAVVALPAAAAAWIGVTGWLAHSELLAARDDLNELRGSIGTSAVRGARAPGAAGSPAEAAQERRRRSAAAHASRAPGLPPRPAGVLAAG